MKPDGSVQSELEQLAARVGAALEQRGWLLVTAESCTGGWVGQVVTSIPGSSRWYERGYVTYSNAAKQELLDVTPAILAAHGAVSEQVVLAMADGALRHSHAHIAAAITGVAGPDGGTATKPVGTVWVGWAVRGESSNARCFVFPGDRAQVRAAAVRAALDGIMARAT